MEKYHKAKKEKEKKPQLSLSGRLISAYASKCSNALATDITNNTSNLPLICISFFLFLVLLGISKHCWLFLKSRYLLILYSPLSDKIDMAVCDLQACSSSGRLCSKLCLCHHIWKHFFLWPYDWTKPHFVIFQGFRLWSLKFLLCTGKLEIYTCLWWRLWCNSKWNKWTI